MIIKLNFYLLYFTFLFTNFIYKYRIVVCENMYKAIKILLFK